MTEILNHTSHNTLGINDVGLINSIDNIKNDIEDIKSVFDTIEKVVDESSNYLQGEVGIAFRNKANSLIYSFPRIESNLFTYVDDLTNFLNNYKEFESTYITNDIN